MSKARKLTADRLHKLVLEEKAKYESSLNEASVKAKEVDASDLASTLEKHVDHLAVLKIKETQARLELKRIQEQKRAITKKLAKLKS